MEEEILIQSDALLVDGDDDKEYSDELLMERLLELVNQRSDECITKLAEMELKEDEEDDQELMESPATSLLFDQLDLPASSRSIQHWDATGTESHSLDDQSVIDEYMDENNSSSRIEGLRSLLPTLRANVKSGRAKPRWNHQHEVNQENMHQNNLSLDLGVNALEYRKVATPPRSRSSLDMHDAGLSLEHPLLSNSEVLAKLIDTLKSQLIAEVPEKSTKVHNANPRQMKSAQKLTNRSKQRNKGLRRGYATSDPVALYHRFRNSWASNTARRPRLERPKKISSTNQRDDSLKRIKAAQRVAFHEATRRVEAARLRANLSPAIRRT